MDIRLCYLLNLSDGNFSCIAAFLNEIGLPIVIGEIQETTFLPGIQICRGKLRVDPEKLQWPGDLLHDAGHLALLSAEQRAVTMGDAGDDGGDELGAIAWSYAAAVRLRLDPAVVFHAGGYKGGSGAILANFADGRYIGVPILEWRGLCADARRAAEEGGETYPHMLRWLRD